MGYRKGELGSALKKLDPQRIVNGMDVATSLDRVHVLDVQEEMPSVGEGAIDCILMADALDYLPRSLEALQRLRSFLRPQGWLVASIRNRAHHSVISDLLLGDFPCFVGAQETRQRFFTFAAALKLFLDAGFAPEIVDRIQEPVASTWHEPMLALATTLDVAWERVKYSLDSTQFIIRGQRLSDEQSDSQRQPVVFSTCVANERALETNLLASPDLKPNEDHKFFFWRGASSAAAGHNLALAQTHCDWVICVHEDVYLPQGWLNRFLVRIREAETLFGRIDVVGVYGITDEQRRRAGRVVDRARLLLTETDLPCLVGSLDEIVVAVRSDSGLRFDPALGWHLYGTDICLAAQKEGRRAAVVDAICFHNQRSVKLPPAFQKSADYLAHKWPERLPIQTSCMLIEGK